jgi:hypothetical protein
MWGELREGPLASKNDIELLMPECLRIPVAVQDDVEPAAIREEENWIDRLGRRGLHPDDVENAEIPDFVGRRRVCPARGVPCPVVRPRAEGGNRGADLDAFDP